MATRKQPRRASTPRQTSADWAARVLAIASRGAPRTTATTMASRSRQQASIAHANAIEHCEPLVARLPPEYEFVYRLPFQLRLLADLPNSVASNELNQLACSPIRVGRLSFVADVRLRQRWAFQRLYLRDISSSISLAPGEVLSLTIRKTQRTQLTENTMRSSDSLESFESALVDKDVLTVQRSTVTSQQWRIDSKADVSLFGVLNFGAGGGFSSSTQQSVNTAIEQVSEATVKASRRLQLLQKIEVARVSESSLESTQTRTITNPYRDRSLTLNVYELAKRYVVTTEFAEIRPAIALEITDLDLNREFVLSQGEFLDRFILDRSLASELREALQATRLPVSDQSEHLKRRYARFAFHYLFEAIGVMNLDGGSSEENDPWQSFVDDEAFEDANGNSAGALFAVLATYLKLQVDIYTNPPFMANPPLALQPPVAPPWRGPFRSGHDLEPQFALALADALAVEWAKIDVGDLGDVLDIGDKTDVIRRIPGFLSIVNGLLRPLVEAAVDQQSASESRRVANDVINRVVSNLHCNRAYYVQAYLRYLFERSGGFAFGDLLSRWLRSGLINLGPNTTPEQMLDMFDPASGLLDGYTFFVPLKFALPLSTALQLIGAASQHSIPIFGGFDTRQEDVNIPADGYHIEPIRGQCTLSDLPPSNQAVNASIDIQAHS